MKTEPILNGFITPPTTSKILEKKETFLHGVSS